MKCLISPVCIEEARILVGAGCEIVDIKNVAEGSLGAQPPWVTREIVTELSGKGSLFSLALGDLPNKPGTIGLAAYGAAHMGVNFIKAGLYGAKDYDDALAMMISVVKAVRMVSEDICVVAAGYADYRRFGGLSYRDLLSAAADSGSDAVMVDTAIKDGKHLFDAMTVAELKEFVDRSREAGLQVALAGSIALDHMDTLCELAPDIIGVRGVVCKGYDRRNSITAEGVHRLKERILAACSEPQTAAGA